MPLISFLINLVFSPSHSFEDKPDADRLSVLSDMSDLERAFRRT